MSIRFWKRLAGCFAIELLQAAALGAADSDYKAAAVQFHGVKTLVLMDRHGNSAAIVQAEFQVTRALADLAVVQLLKAHPLERTGVLIRGVAPGEGRAGDVVTAVESALRQLEPAAVRFGAGVLSVASNGKCVGSLQIDGTLALDRCGGGSFVRAPIRSAFQVVEPARGLLRRSDKPVLYPVQAIAFGAQATILGLGGDAPVSKFRGRNLVVVPFANDSSPMPEDDRVNAAIRQVLRRVKYSR